jgi:hypothetical protein
MEGKAGEKEDEKKERKGAKPSEELIANTRV